MIFTMIGQGQKLLTPRNNMEYMCVPQEIISNFDGIDDFELVAGEFIKDKLNHIQAVSSISPNGLNNTNGLEMHALNVPKWGASFFLKYKKEIILGNNTVGIGFWVKSNNDATANFYFEDATGLVFFVAKEFIEGESGWKYTYAVTESIKKTNTLPLKTNPAIQYPCRFLGINFSVFENDTKIYIDDISKVKEITTVQSAKVQVHPQKLANVYLQNEDVSLTAESVSNKIKVILKNYKGEEILQKNGDKSLIVQLPTSALGYFEAIVLSYRDSIEPTNLIKGEVFQYAVTDGKTFQNERLSVAVHPQRDYYDIKSVDLTKILGSKYMRFGLVMEFIEKDDGSFALSDHTLEILNYAKSEDLKFICVFRDKTPPLTPERTEKFLNFCRYLLDEFRNVIDKVELWNEWTHGTGTHQEFKDQQTPGNYTKFLKEIYPVLKEEYPNVEFIGLGGENPQRFLEDIKNMYKAGASDYMDAISLHPYRQPKAPDSRLKNVHNLNMSEQVTNVIDISKTYNGPEKVYITEIGYPGNHLDFGVSDFTQAQYLVKAQGLLLTSNVVENITWYNLYTMYELGLPKNYLGREDDYPQFYFGLFEGAKNDFAVKNAAMAYRFFANITEGFDNGKQYDDGKGFHKLTMYGKTNGELEILWNNYGNMEYTLPFGVEIYDLMGNPIHKQETLNISREPVYILKSKLTSN